MLKPKLFLTIHFATCRPEAGQMDAQQRLLLENVYEALSQAGSATGRAARTAVIVGIGAVDYVTLSTDHLGVGSYSLSGGLQLEG